VSGGAGVAGPPGVPAARRDSERATTAGIGALYAGVGEGRLLGMGQRPPRRSASLSAVALQRFARHNVESPNPMMTVAVQLRR